MRETKVRRCVAVADTTGTSTSRRYDHRIEGDTLGSDTVVKEIRPDGVVLEFRGTRFLVPRGGG